MLRVALQHHQAKRLTQAEETYRQILEQQPDHAETLHYLEEQFFLGESGRYEQAVELISKALIATPANARFPRASAATTHDGESLTEAEQSLRRRLS